VTKNEGLRSPQAIAFIQANGSRVNIRLNQNDTVGALGEKVAQLLQNKSYGDNPLNLGDSKWTN
jgi:hypothetical protein